MFFSIPTGTELFPIKLLHFKLTPEDAYIAILLCFQISYPPYILSFLYMSSLFTVCFCFCDSMNHIIDKYSTHSKNLGKSHQQSPIDLNVCYVSNIFLSFLT